MRAKSSSAVICLVAAILVLGALGAAPAAAQSSPPPGTLPAEESRFSSNEIINAGHTFFGTVSRGLAQVVEKAVSQWGLPNAYVLGEVQSFFDKVKERIFLLSVWVGWLLTAIAVSLGAPFWFDTLSKFINIRAAGTKPQK